MPTHNGTTMLKLSGAQHQLNPRASTAYLRMAIVYARHGKLPQAKQARARAIALDPSLANYRMPSSCTMATC